MAYFLVKYHGQSGDVLSKTVEASSEEQAISNSGLPRAIIKSVQPDMMGAIKKAFSEKRFPLNVQILALVTIASKLEAGKTTGRAVMESLEYESIGVTKQDLEACETPADYFRILRFDDTVVLLAEAGDKAGNIAEALQRAAEVIKSREATRKEFAKPMRSAIINGGAGLLAAIAFPIFGGGMMHKFIYLQKLPIEPNQFSHILMFLRGFYLSSWPYVIVALILGFVFRAKVIEHTRLLPIIRVFTERARCKRGLEFVQTYQMLSKSGYANPQIFRFLAERAEGRSAVIYKNALQRQIEGREFGQVLDDPEWPKIMSQNLVGFESQVPDGREKILKNLAMALSEMFTQHSETIARLMGTMALFSMLGSILSFGLGFMIPMMTMKIQM